MDFHDIVNSSALFSGNISFEKNNISNAHLILLQNVSHKKPETLMIFQGSFNFYENIIKSSKK